MQDDKPLIALPGQLEMLEERAREVSEQLANENGSGDLVKAGGILT